MPAAIVACQRGWGVRKTSLFAGAILGPHVLLGALIYFGFEPFLSRLRAEGLLLFSLALVVFSLVVRWIRFKRVDEVLRAGPLSIWGLFAVFSLLGPCEWIIPILIQAGHLHAGYLTVVVAFLLGTWSGGVALALLGRALWGRPFWLPWGMGLATRSRPVAPVLAFIAMGIGALLRLRH